MGRRGRESEGHKSEAGCQMNYQHRPQPGARTHEL